MIEYRFSDFTLSPQRRLLLRDGREVPLIPRYFDLLLLLVERRREAVHRREIFDRVWADGIVSDSALTQAIRTIRRTLGDEDPREPRFIRTVSRHGYQFVFPEVHELGASESQSAAPAGLSDTRGEGAAPHASLVEADDVARAHARGSRTPAWDGAAGGALAGAWGGAMGGLLLTVAPGSSAPLVLAPVLAVVGAGCGAIGGVGVGAGLGVADRLSPSRQTLALTIAGAIGGGLVGTAVQWLARWALAALVGIDLPIGGGIEGLVLGAAAGLGTALTGATAGDESSQPRTFHAAIVIALLCGVAALALALTGRPLAGGTIHLIADAADGSRATLAPLGRLLGEPDLGPVTRALVAFGEGATFGFGFGWGLTRPRRRA